MGLDLLERHRCGQIDPALPAAAVELRRDQVVLLSQELRIENCALPVAEQESAALTRPPLGDPVGIGQGQEHARPRPPMRRPGRDRRHPRSGSGAPPRGPAAALRGSTSAAPGGSPQRCRAGGPDPRPPGRPAAQDVALAEQRGQLARGPAGGHRSAPDDHVRQARVEREAGQPAAVRRDASGSRRARRARASSARASASAALGGGSSHASSAGSATPAAASSSASGARSASRISGAPARQQRRVLVRRPIAGSTRRGPAARRARAAGRPTRATPAPSPAGSCRCAASSAAPAPGRRPPPRARRRW